MTQRKSNKVIIFDVFLVAFWLMILFIEIFFIQDIIITIAAIVGVFIFSAVLGRDIRRQRGR